MACCAGGLGPMGLGREEGLWGGCSQLYFIPSRRSVCSHVYSHICSLPEGVEGQILHSQGAKSYPQIRASTGQIDHICPTFALWLGPPGFFPEPWFLNL